MNSGLNDYIMNRAKYSAEKYKQSLKMWSASKEGNMIKIKPTTVYGFTLEKKEYKE